jgi:hypothetical protein
LTEFKYCLFCFGFLLSRQGWADAPLDPTWIDLRITSCEVRIFAAPWWSAFFGTRYTYGDSFKTIYIEGNVEQSGTSKDPRPKQLAQPLGEKIALSAPELTSTFCSEAIGKTMRFTYSYVCDTLEKKGRCLPPVPDARLTN